MDPEPSEPVSRLVDRTWPEVGGGWLLVVPVGSCEQHGPHLPLDTDTVIAESLATELSRRTEGVVVGPPVTIGSSGEHQGFAGTLSIGTDTLRSVLVEIARSALPEAGSGLPEPFRAVLFLNGHGGNTHALEGACALLTREGRPVRSWSPQLPGADAHAGHTETSLMLHLQPQRVALERIEVGNDTPIAELSHELRTAGVASVAENGVLGDPTKATAAHGSEIFEGLVESLLADLGPDPNATDGPTDGASLGTTDGPDR